MGIKSVKIGKVLGVDWERRRQCIAYHAIFIGLKCSRNLRWLNILIKTGTNKF